MGQISSIILPLHTWKWGTKKEVHSVRADMVPGKWGKSVNTKENYKVTAPFFEILNSRITLDH